MPDRQLSRAVPAWTQAQHMCGCAGPRSAPLHLPPKSHTRSPPRPDGRSRRAEHPRRQRPTCSRLPQWYRHGRLAPRSAATEFTRVRVKSGQSPSIFLSRPGEAPDQPPLPTPAATAFPSNRELLLNQHPRTDRPSRRPPPHKHRDSPARPSPAPFCSRPGGRGAAPASLTAEPEDRAAQAAGAQPGPPGRAAGTLPPLAPGRRRAARSAQRQAAPPMATAAPGALRWRLAAAPQPASRAALRPLPRRRSWRWAGPAASGQPAACRS